MKKLVVDKTKCISCGTCTFVYPECFEVGKDGKAQVKEDGCSDSKKIKSAIFSCPSGAISCK
jgi:ferredoxin